ncbi:hypothetical protein WA577_000004 [Blastocystis sp. JDR]
MRRRKDDELGVCFNKPEFPRLLFMLLFRSRNKYRKNNMVLAELGKGLTNALAKLQTTTVIDDAVVASIIKDITNALLHSDVNMKLVMNLRTTINNRIQVEFAASGINKRKVIQRIVYEELVNMLSPVDVQPFKPVKGKSNVIMFVGLQGSGKTTTIGKFAAYYKRKGWKTCMVCADTFRAGAFDQLKQNAVKVKVPFYGSYTEADPVVIAEQGVEQFRKEKFEIIIVDTSGRHKQEEGLFEEMKQVAARVHPDDIVFVLDSTIGQAAYDQASAFKSAVSIGSVIITKLDGNAKGGGAISAVAATGAPIIFTGSGEGFDDLEPFAADSFVSRLLGMGDMKGLVRELKEGGALKVKDDVAKHIQKGKLTMRDFGEQLQAITKMGSLDRMVSMIPGLQNMVPQGAGKEGAESIKRMMTLMNSMTDAELDGEVEFTDKRLRRACIGAGLKPEEGAAFMQMYKSMEGMIGKIGKSPLMNDEKMMQQMKRNPQAVMKQLQGAMNPQMLKQMGGMQNMMSMMKGMNINPNMFKGFM